jgi:hypothetical protein
MAELDLQPVLDVQPVEEESGAGAEALDLQPAETEPRNTLEKVRLSAGASAAQGAADVGKGLEHLSDIGAPRASFGRHEAAMIRAGAEDIPYESAMGELLAEREAARQALMGPGRALAKGAGDIADAARGAAAATPGNPWAAKAGELVGGMLPYLLSGPAAPITAGVATYGSTYDKALDYYRKTGFSEGEAQKQAERVAGTSGLASAEIFGALPGFGKATAEKLLAEHLTKASPVVRAAVNTLAASGQGGLVLGADSLVKNAQAKSTYRPDLSWSEALSEAAKDALAGTVGTALVHAPMEAAALLRAKIQSPKLNTQQSEGQSEKPGEGQPSEFGGEEDLPPLVEQESTPSPRPSPPGEGAEALDIAPVEEKAPAAQAATPVEEIAKLGSSAIAGDILRTAIGAREQVPSKLFEDYNAGAENPMVLPEGYERQGDTYVFTEPPEKLTPEQVAARERVQSMQEFRAQKEANAATEETPSEDPNWDVAPGDEPNPQDEGVTPLAEPGVPIEIHDERPPDIIDWIEGNFGGKIRVSSKADYGDFVKEATGKAREMLSNSKGDGADTIMEEMHAQGMYPRIQSEGDFLEAVNRASAQRIGWRERQRTHEKRLGDWVARLEGAKLKPGAEVMGALIPGLDPHTFRTAWNSALDVAIAAVKAGRVVREAVEAAVRHLKERFGTAVDEGKLRIAIGSEFATPVRLPEEAVWQRGNKANHAAAREVGRKLQGTAVRNEDTGWDITFNKEGIEHTLYDDRTPEHFQSLGP